MSASVLSEVDNDFLFVLSLLRERLVAWHHVVFSATSLLYANSSPSLMRLTVVVSSANFTVPVALVPRHTVMGIQGVQGGTKAAAIWGAGADGQ